MMSKYNQDINTEMEECDYCGEILQDLRELAHHIHNKHVGTDCKLASCWTCKIQYRNNNKKKKEVVTSRMTAKNPVGQCEERFEYKVKEIDDIPPPKAYIEKPIPVRFRPVIIPLHAVKEVRDPRRFKEAEDNKPKWVILDKTGKTDYIYGLLPPTQ